MRLLNTTTLQLSLVDDESCPPPYAVLSYCWGSIEPLYDEYQKMEQETRKFFFPNLHNACSEAQRKWGLEWMWVDTVCIDRSSSAELSEAINSMFQWYQNCQVCLVYLNDLMHQDLSDNLEPLLAQCTWMSRAWTLQELIAPKELLFYDKEWTRVGTKASLISPLSRITTVDAAVLEDSECIPDVSIGKRMSWAAHRSARCVEDMAYSLLGIFSVNIPIVYGEGSRAFLRLQEEILKNTADASLFAWQTTCDHTYRGMLAHCPAEFAHFANWSSSAPLRIAGDIQTTSAGIVINGAFAAHTGMYDFILRLSSANAHEDELESSAILLKEWKGDVVRLALAPQQTLALTRLYKEVNGVSQRVCVRRDVDLRTSRTIQESLSTPEQKGHHVNQLAISATKIEEKASRHSLLKPFSAQPSLHASGTPTALTEAALYHHDLGSDRATVAWQLSRSTLGGKRTSLDDYSVVSHTGKSSSEAPYDIDYQELSSRNEEASVDSEYNKEPSISIGYDELAQDSSSEEYDMYLFESTSQEPLTLYLSPEFAKLTDELAGIALKNFVLHVSRSQTAAKRSKAGDMSTRTRKKVKAECFDSCMDIDQHEDENEDYTVHVGRVRPERACLACPFYAMNPGKHQDCLTRVGLRGIKDLKQHIWTCHRRPPFCPICRDTFSTSAACDDHIKSRSCSLQEVVAPPEGISEAQMQRLARRGDPSQAAECQWRLVWGIIYPSTEPPAQSYLTGETELIVCTAREYWLKYGQGIISDFLERKGLRDYRVKDEERNLAALYRTTLDRMLDALVASFKEDDYGPRGPAMPFTRLHRLWTQTLTK